MEIIAKDKCENLIRFMDDVPKDTPLFQLEYAIICAVLNRNKGNRTWTAKDLRISLRTLKLKLIQAKYYGFEIHPAARCPP